MRNIPSLPFSSTGEQRGHNAGHPNPAAFPHNNNSNNEVISAIGSQLHNGAAIQARQRRGKSTSGEEREGQNNEQGEKYISSDGETQRPYFRICVVVVVIIIIIVCEPLSAEYPR
jgi:hypothetical protein